LKKILITGAAGFIGYHLCQRMVEEGYQVIGLDNINDYYDVNLKYARLRELGVIQKEIEDNQLITSNKFDTFSFIKLDLCDNDNLTELFDQIDFNYVVNLAAQAGVRYSLENPYAYITSNIDGFFNLLQCSKEQEIDHFVYASSSSVYGLNQSQSFSTSDNVDHPVSLYAASKKSNELIAHSYSHLYELPSTGLRFFTVYGPWGRPDMALFLFTKAILNNEPIDVYNYGNMQRDFTYIDDIIEGVKRVIENPARPDPDWSGKHPDPHSSQAPYKIYNIGNNEPVNLMDFIEAIENKLGQKAEKNMLPLQPGDVVKTNANISDLKRELDYNPDTGIKEGIDKFIDWYRKFYNT
jgi:UDP-glucuronate 4-epimerase